MHTARVRLGQLMQYTHTHTLYAHIQDVYVYIRTVRSKLVQFLEDKEHMQSTVTGSARCVGAGRSPLVPRLWDGGVPKSADSFGNFTICEYD